MTNGIYMWLCEDVCVCNVYECVYMYMGPYLLMASIKAVKVFAA